MGAVAVEVVNTATGEIDITDQLVVQIRMVLVDAAIQNGDLDINRAGGDTPCFRSIDVRVRHARLAVFVRLPLVI